MYIVENSPPNNTPKPTNQYYVINTNLQFLMYPNVQCNRMYYTHTCSTLTHSQMHFVIMLAICTDWKRVWPEAPAAMRIKTYFARMVAVPGFGFDHIESEMQTYSVCMYTYMFCEQFMSW